MLHKLRQLGRCTNTDTPDTAYQLYAEVVPAGVAYTRSHTQPSCSGVGESDCVIQPGHDRLTPSYIMTLTDAPTTFKVGLQGLTVQSTIKAELVAAALTMKDEAVFCSNTMSELGFGESFGSVPLHIDNTSALHIADNPTYIPRAKHIALRYYFFVQELVDGKVGIDYVKSEGQLADSWAPSNIASTVTATLSSSSTTSRLETPTSSSTTKGRPSSLCVSNTCVLVTIFSVLRSYLQRCTYNALLFRSR